MGVLCVSDHYMQVLSCKQRCALELATNTDQPFLDFLPSHFNYLQFSYYNSKAGGGNFSVRTPCWRKSRFSCVSLSR